MLCGVTRSGYVSVMATARGMHTCNAKPYSSVLNTFPDAIEWVAGLTLVTTAKQD